MTAPAQGKTHSKRRVPSHVAAGTVVAVLFALGIWLWHESYLHRQDQEMIASIKAGNFQATLYLLRNGADPNATQDVRRGTSILSQVLNLIKRDSDNLSDKGMPAIEVFFTPERDLGPGVHPGRMDPIRYDVLRVLIARGANLRVRDDSYLYGENAPITAYPARWGYLDCLRLMLDHGGDVNAQNADGESLLMFAVDPTSKRRAWQAATVDLLLKRGADPHHKNSNGDTALSYAVDAEDTEIVRLIKQRW